jgi:hypothetical protein
MLGAMIRKLCIYLIFQNEFDIADSVTSSVMMTQSGVLNVCLDEL